jgi:hypothetical protein
MPQVMKIKFSLFLCFGIIALAFLFNSCKKKKEEEAPVTLASIVTSDVTNISENFAKCGGTITNGGSSAVFAAGVCWNTSPGPTISNDHTTINSGGITFISNIAGLQPNTTYYVKAYATNDAGTAYGEEKSFKTSGVWTNIRQGTVVTSIVCNGSDIIVGTNGSGAFKSTDNGLTWTNVFLYSGKVTSMIRTGTQVFAGTNANGIFCSGNSGVSWNVCPGVLSTGNINALHNVGNDLYAIRSYDGIYRSLDQGLSWNRFNTGLGNDSLFLEHFAGSGTTIFTGGAINYAGLYKLDNGGNWINIYANANARSIAVSNNSVFANSNFAGSIISSDLQGTNWSPLPISGLPWGSNNPLLLIWTNNKLYGGNYGFTNPSGGVYYYNVNNWVSVCGGLPVSAIITMASNSSYLFASTEDGGLYRLPLQ